LRHHRAPAAALAGVQLRLVEASGRVALDPVDEALEPADPHPLVAEPVTYTRRAQLIPLVQRRPCVHTYRELSASLQLLIDRELFRARVVVDGRDTVTREVGHRRMRLSQPLLERLRRYCATYALCGGRIQSSGHAVRDAFDPLPLARCARAFECDVVGEVLRSE